jgi:glutathione S-transferase
MGQARGVSLTLYVDAFWISPYAMSCFVALEELGVPYRAEPIALHTQQHRAAWYRNGSLTGRVPSLRHGELWLSESSAIDEYLAEVFPPPEHPRLLPAAPAERARARELMAWLRSDLMPIREERATHTVFYRPSTAALSPAGQAAAAGLLAVADRLLVAGRTTLFESWCIADTDFAMMLKRLDQGGFEPSAKVRAYLDAQWSRPSVQRWVGKERAPYVPY